VVGVNAGDERCQAITVDSSNNIFCTGYTTGSLGEANGGSWDVFVMKLNVSGALQWVRQLGAVTVASGGSNTGLECATSITTDSSR